MPLVKEDEKRLRALAMLEARVKQSKTLKQIAAEFNVSENTVKRTLSWARKADLVVEAEDRILQELVPAAHNALIDVLKGDNDKAKAAAAIAVFKGILPSFEKAKAGRPSDANGGDELGKYIEKLRSGLGVVEGEIEGRDVRALPAATEADSAEGPAESDRGDAAGDGTSEERPKDVGE